MYQSVMSEMTVLSKITLGLRGRVCKMTQVHCLPLIFFCFPHVSVLVFSHVTQKTASHYPPILCPTKQLVWFNPLKAKASPSDHSSIKHTTVIYKYYLIKLTNNSTE